MKRSGTLVIGDTRAFGRVIRTLLEPIVAQTGPLTETTYDDCRGLLTGRVLQGTALFVLELWRSYPTGWRAEGVAVAEQLMRIGALPLIVSPLSQGAELDALCYWDLGSRDALSDRVARVLRAGGSSARSTREEIESLKWVFRDHLAKPVGHEDVSASGRPA